MPYPIHSLEKIVPTLFRAYDIRGRVPSELNAKVMYAIGLAIAEQARAYHRQRLVVARDGRVSSPMLHTALTQGLCEGGCDLIDIGVVPTPMLYFGTHFFSTHSGVMLTGSHNRGDYNGCKIVLDGKALTEDGIQRLYQRIIARDFTKPKKVGTSFSQDISAEYLDRIAQSVTLSKPIKVVVDAGNGVAGKIAPQVFRRLGCQVVELFCEIDGRFPNHHPDPSVLENLQDLQRTVLAEKADVGLALDGDGDRLGMVTNDGEVVWPDRQMMLFAEDVLGRNPGADILFDVKCTRHLADVIKKAGGKPRMWKTGHSLMKAKMQAIQAPLAGEMSGHIFFKENWYGFDDGIYAGARLLKILDADTRSSAEIFNAFPNSLSTPELKIPLEDKRKQTIVEAFKRDFALEGAHINTIDGVRADFSDGWGLLRASNTSPCLTVRFEADNFERLKRIQMIFRNRLLAVDKGLALPF